MDHRVIDAIQKERDKQHYLWGPIHDYKHTPNSWRIILEREASSLMNGNAPRANTAALVKVAAVAIAALEDAREKADEA